VSSISSNIICFLPFSLNSFLPSFLGSSFIHSFRGQSNAVFRRILPTLLQELSMAALRAPRNIEDAAKAKIPLLRSRAAEAAVWVLADPNFLEDACRLLIGLVS
ncbi:unnamed protein product, partial [Ectocarpus sp. 4 AP-2014]